MLIVILTLITFSIPLSHIKSTLWQPLQSYQLQKVVIPQIIITKNKKKLKASIALILSGIYYTLTGVKQLNVYVHFLPINDKDT